MLMAVVATAAFVAWGIYANWDHNVGQIAQVAVTQGIVSFVATWTTSEVLVFFYRKLFKKPGAVWWTSILSYLSTYSIILLVHWIAGTPEFWPTVLPGMFTGLGFCALYSFRVKNWYQKAEIDPASAKPTA